MAFMPAKGSKLDPSFLTNVILDNSITFNVGDAISSYLHGVGSKHVFSGVPLLGVIIGFEGSGGLQLTPTAYAKGTTAILPDSQSVTTAADNTTGAQIKAIVCADPFTRWSVGFNSTTPTGEDILRGARYDTDIDSNAGRLTIASVTRSPSVVANWYSYGVDPDNADRIIVSISSSELFQKQG